MFHCRTALHWAAMGGHADCVRVLCSDATTVVGADGIARPLRDVVSTDLQVHTSKFIDQRSFGGLTPLHFAAVSGDLDTMQVLLHAGAATMVKTDGEAFIGDDYLTPGSTPLHIAVLVGSVPLAHALLQAHAQLMTLAGSGRDERRRRPWEGHSRTDVRSMRNAQRKLPYHLARERGRQQLTHLVDPRVSIDAALDAARDTEHGIGPKHLSTICSLVLQTSLLGWLDQCQEQMRADKERAAADTPVQEQQAAQRTTRRSWSMTSLVGLRVPSSNTALPAEGDSNAAVVHLAAPEPVVDSGDRSPFATAQEAASEPTTPRDGDSMVGVPPGGAATAPAVPSLEAARLDSLHAYVGMLSKKRVVPLGSPARGMRPDRCATLDGSGLPFGRPSAPVAPRMPRASSTGALQRLAVPALADEDGNGGMQPGAMRRALSTLRGRLLSSDSHNAGCDDGSGHGFSMSKDDSGSGCGGSSGGKGTGFDTDSTVCGSVCSEDCGDSAGVQDKECGVCLDHVVEVAFSGCEHALCLECARHLTKQDKKPPSCPFCRRMVVGFTRVPAANRVVV